MTSRGRHNLPEFPEHVAANFKHLCIEATNLQMRELTSKVQKYIDQLEDLARKREYLNLDLAREVAKRCRFMIQIWQDFPPHERTLIVGAIRYFLSHDDAVSDISFGSGFHDDAKVVNYVLDQLSIEGMFIDWEIF